MTLLAGLLFAIFGTPAVLGIVIAILVYAAVTVWHGERREAKLAEGVAREDAGSWAQALRPVLADIAGMVIGGIVLLLALALLSGLHELS